MCFQFFLAIRDYSCATILWTNQKLLPNMTVCREIHIATIPHLQITTCHAVSTNNNVQILVRESIVGTLNTMHQFCYNGKLEHHNCDIELHNCLKARIAIDLYFRTSALKSHTRNIFEVPYRHCIRNPLR